MRPRSAVIPRYRLLPGAMLYYNPRPMTISFVSTPPMRITYPFQPHSVHWLDRHQPGLGGSGVRKGMIGACRVAFKALLKYWWMPPGPYHPHPQRTRVVHRLVCRNPGREAKAAPILLTTSADCKCDTNADNECLPLTCSSCQPFLAGKT